MSIIYFVIKGFGWGYVSFIVNRLSFVEFKTKDEADTWSRPKPINDKQNIGGTMGDTRLREEAPRHFSFIVPPP
jgi:hypothetical protein